MGKDEGVGTWVLGFGFWMKEIINMMCEGQKGKETKSNFSKNSINKKDGGEYRKI